MLAFLLPPGSAIKHRQARLQQSLQQQQQQQQPALPARNS
jgi:hypothetical protein